MRYINYSLASIVFKRAPKKKKKKSLYQTLHTECEKQGLGRTFFTWRKEFLFLLMLNLLLFCKQGTPHPSVLGAHSQFPGGRLGRWGHVC